MLIKITGRHLHGRRVIPKYEVFQVSAMSFAIDTKLLCQYLFHLFLSDDVLKDINKLEIAISSDGYDFGQTEPIQMPTFSTSDSW